MISVERMNAVDINSGWRGVPPRILMENAGAGLAREILNHKKDISGVEIFAGKGNNGGDGFVTARHFLKDDIPVRVILLGNSENITTTTSEKNWKVLEEMEDTEFNLELISISDSKELENIPDFDSDVLIDAMLGTGVRGAPREPVASALNIFNEKEGLKVAVDIPTGVDPYNGESYSPVSKCDLTVTFHDIKPGLEKASEEFVGKINSVNIGIPSTAQVKTGPGDVMMVEEGRKKNSHKGQNGRLLIIGGGSKYSGAPGLAGLAALRSGVDLVTVAVPGEASQVVSSFSPDLITHSLEGDNFRKSDVEEIENFVKRSGAVLLGPGLGKKPETRDGVLKLLDLLIEEYSEKPVLLDADGLKIASNRQDLLGEGNFVLTPHSGEFEIVTGTTLPDDFQGRIRRVEEMAIEMNSHIVLKGHLDICANPDGNHLINDTGNPGMTVGGTGDVLAGVIGSYISRSSNLFEACAAGTFITGLAGDICEEDLGYGFTATDVKDKIPYALKESKEYW